MPRSVDYVEVDVLIETKTRDAYCIRCDETASAFWIPAIMVRKIQKHGSYWTIKLTEKLAIDYGLV